MPIVILFDINGTIGLKTESLLPGYTKIEPIILRRGKQLYPRPNVQQFVRSLADHPSCKVGIYSTWQSQNANAARDALGLTNDVFYVFCQNESDQWCVQDPEDYNEKKKIYGWKKNVSALLPHFQRYHPDWRIDLSKIVVLDDSARKTRDFPRNRILVPEFTETQVRTGNDSVLVKLQSYLLTLLNSKPDDVREYIAEHPFSMDDEVVENLTNSMSKLGVSSLLPKKSSSSYFSPIDTANPKGQLAWTFHNSMYKVKYDKINKNDLEKSSFMDQVRQHLEALLKMRKIPEYDWISTLKVTKDCIKLWSSDVLVSYEISRGDQVIRTITTPFYRFLNEVIRKDDAREMEHVAFLVRAFNFSLANGIFQPKPNCKLYRGTRIPETRLKQFYSQNPPNFWFRIPTFFAVTYSKEVATRFTEEKDGKVVLYEISIPSILHHAKDISKQSEYAAEEEVLFPPYSLFRFLELKEDPKQNCFIVRLQAASDNQEGGEKLELVPSPAWQ